MPLKKIGQRITRLLRQMFIFKIKMCIRDRLNANYTGAGRIYWTEENSVSQAFYGTLNGRISLSLIHI